MRAFLLGITLLAIGLLSPAAVTAQELLETPTGPWTHDMTGTVFPEKAGNFKRSKIYKYDEDGSDTSVGYSLETEGGFLFLTFYVYPAPADVECKTVFDGVVQDVFEHEGTTLSGIGRPSAPWLDANARGYWARFNIPARSMGPNYPAFVSDAFLHCPENSRWLIKSRMSWDGDEEGFPDTEILLNAIQWSDTLLGIG